MTEQNPITPPRELVKQWHDEWIQQKDSWICEYIATQAARWGADTELDACCNWLRENDDAYELVALREVYLDDELRAARRPKQLSLKEQALAALERAEEGWRPVPADCEIIRRALEQLDD